MEAMRRNNSSINPFDGLPIAVLPYYGGYRRSYGQQQEEESRRARRRNMLLLLVAPVIILLAIGAYMVFRKAQEPEIVVEPLVQLSTMDAGPITEGAMSVIVTSDKDIVVTVIATAEAGVLFRTADGIQVDNHRRVVTISNLSMRANESRMLRFAYDVDPDTQLSGDYEVDVGVSRPSNNGKNAKWLSAVASNLYIDTTEGLVRFLPSPIDS